MIIAGDPSMAECDSCGDRAEAIEVRKPKTGALSAAFLPEGWTLDKIEREIFHRCPACSAASVQPFADRRDAFDARLDHHGTSLLPVIAAGLGLPESLARRWAAEWQADQFGAVEPLDDRAVPIGRLMRRNLNRRGKR